MTERERLINILDKTIAIKDEDTNDYIEWLADELLANGIIVPPCKVGTPLYFLSGDLEECEIIESSSWSYIIDSLGLITIEETLHELSYKDNYEYVFGATVFSTREEAEKALKEVNEK